MTIKSPGKKRASVIENFTKVSSSQQKIGSALDYDFEIKKHRIKVSLYTTPNGSTRPILFAG